MSIVEPENQTVKNGVNLSHKETAQSVQTLVEMPNSVPFSAISSCFGVYKHHYS